MYNPGFLDLERASDKSNQRKVSKICVTFSAYVDAYLSPYIYENKGAAPYQPYIIIKLNCIFTRLTITH